MKLRNHNNYVRYVVVYTESVLSIVIYKSVVASKSDCMNNIIIIIIK